MLGTCSFLILFHIGYITFVHASNTVNDGLVEHDIQQIDTMNEPDQIADNSDVVLSAPVYGNRSPAIYEGDDSFGHCHFIDEPVCQGLQYSHTYFPNSVGLASQDEAAKRMNDYRALISVGCSEYLKFFLCTVYFPMCAPTPGAMKTLQPCRKFCRYVQSRCEPIMKSFSFPWPKELNCNSFPSTSELCIQPETYELDQKAGQFSQQLAKVSPKEIADILPDLSEIFREKYMNEKPAIASNPDITKLPSVTDKTKRRPFSNVHKEFFKHVNCNSAELPLLPHKSGENITCAQRCHANVYYRYAEKRFAELWLLIWSVLCAISCSITIITFLIDRSRYVYPERAIVYISVCCLFYSLGIILRIAVGRERVSCRELADGTMQKATHILIPTAWPDPTPGAHLEATDLHGVKYLITTGREGTICTIVFIITYYFIQSSNLWWVMLAVAWFLSAVCKWGCEGIDAISSVLHLMAWAIPAVKTMLVLILHRIDADELTGLCGVGYRNKQSQLLFVILPHMIYLLIGLVLFTIGFFSLVSVRANLMQNNLHIRTTSQQTSLPGQSACSLLQDTSKTSISTEIDYKNVRRLDKLMMKICVFSTLYVIPSICVIGANWYTFTGQKQWNAAVTQIARRPECLSESGTNWDILEECLGDMKFPIVEVKMLHSFMSLAVGITSGMWIWCNRKTFVSWSSCLLGRSGRKLLKNRNTIKVFRTRKPIQPELTRYSVKSLFTSTLNQQTRSPITRSFGNEAERITSRNHENNFGVIVTRGYGVQYVQPITGNALPKSTVAFNSSPAVA